jgi:hypothetical protein
MKAFDPILPKNRFSKAASAQLLKAKVEITSMMRLVMTKV